MKIKRTLETANATYDLLGLTREEFSRLFSAYRYESAKMHGGYGYTEHDELLKKFEDMANSDTLIL